MDARRRASPRRRRVVARASRRASRDGDSRRRARDRRARDASVSGLFAHTSVKRSVAATSWSVCRRSERRSDADARDARRRDATRRARATTTRARSRDRVAMCGIFAYSNWNCPKSQKEIVEKLLTGLKRLEYRGYDSAGLAIEDGEDVSRTTAKVFRETGKIANLEGLLEAS